MVRRMTPRLAIPILTAVALAVLPAAAVEPLFGPQTYDRTAGPPDTYGDTFDVPAAVNAVVWIQNGDGDAGDRTSSATVQINNVTVAGPADFSRAVDLVAKAIPLPKGTATLGVQMSGEPGSSVTVTIMPLGTRPDVELGRLILPYASGSSLTLSLKNGARRPRAVRIVFFDDAGNPVAHSDRLVVPPRGAMSKPAADLIATGSFASGSVEVLWAGRGAGRVFGEATVKDDLTGVESVINLQRAGTKRIDPLDPTLKFGR